MSKELFTRRESVNYPGLWVKKYAKKVFFDNLWNDELVECRGHVETTDGQIVIRPFTKIFNRFENGTDIARDELVIAIRKMNGFMGCLTYIPSLGKSIVSTTGSLDSPYVEYARQMLPEYAFDVCTSYHATPFTFMFEIVHPDDPHVVKETPGAYLIGMRRVSDESPYMSNINKEIQLDYIAREMGVMRPFHVEDRFSSIVKAAAACQHEGFVVYSKDKSLKIKSPFYLTTKFLGRLGKSKLERMGRDPLSFKQELDEEFYPVLHAINNQKELFMTLDEQGRMKFIREILVAM